jgi:hypothetical protein
MSTKLKLYNPKSHTPAVYIPCWLIQVPTSLLSNNAKIFYGRLAQWSSATGIIYRSLNQLSKELGTPARTLERPLKELKECGLIGTYHSQAGGVNYYAFYDHPWMHEPIVDELVYKQDPIPDENDPPTNLSVPPRKCAGTPPADLRYINKKEIKDLKDISEVTTSPASTEKKVDEEIVAAYHELMPSNPKIKVIDNKLKSQLKQMRANWPQYQKDGKKFSIESFKDYLRFILTYHPWFLKPYTNANGIKKTNSLRNITTPTNLAKFVNGEFSATTY